MTQTIEMGRTYLFECSHCGYCAKVAGRRDKGLFLKIQTVLCSDCKQLHDVVTDLKLAVPPPFSEPFVRKRTKTLAEQLKQVEPLRPPSFAAALNRLPPAGAKRFRWQKFKPACPVSSLHRVRDWNQPDRCPKCGVVMERNALPFRIWD